MPLQPLKILIAVVASLALGITVAACGSDDNGGGGASSGGNVKILETAGGLDSLDPGYWYYQTDYTNGFQTTQRALYGWKPDETTPTPDAATALPKASNGGKTVTITIRDGIKYSPCAGCGLKSPTVRSADVKYAIERCFLPAVGNGYANLYYDNIEGVKDFTSGKADDISGITTPDDTTLVIKTTVPNGVIASGAALGMPCTVPVPKEYAQQYDKGKQSTYGEHQVFTGAYMFTNNGKGDITGYKPGQRLSLVRNPNWDKSTDFRPAYFDRIDFQGGFDATVAARRTLKENNLLNGDYAAPPTPVLKQGLSCCKDQLSIEPSGGNRYISLNTQVKPLDNVNVRRAISAVIDRTALRQTRGGPTLGTLATHLLPPGLGGFDDAGGNKGPGFDFTPPTSNVEVAKSYMKKAGYSNGMYSGPPILTIADNESPAKETAQAFQEQVKKIGLKLQYREVPHATMLTKFCQVPSQKVGICPNLGWGADFFAPQSFFGPLFSGKNIVPSGNVNTAMVNDPKLDRQIDAARQITDTAEANKAWGDLDKEVTDQSYFITWLWDNNVSIQGPNMKGVPSAFNSGAFDLSFSSQK
jgi:peptide/nickel transport system substrate-binding protein